MTQIQNKPGRKILIATFNHGKLAEYRELLQNLDYQVLGLDEADAHALGYREPEENGLTFEENSFIKARTAGEFFKMPCVADDSGLCVTALGGEPGIYSARYGGAKDDTKRMEYLLSKMSRLSDRSAHFYCDICLYVPGSNTAEHFSAKAEGIILTSALGNQGFGYDPVFYYPPLKKTFAQLDMDEKNKVSHRSLACSKLIDYLKTWIPK